MPRKSVNSFADTCLAMTAGAQLAALQASNPEFVRGNMTRAGFVPDLAADTGFSAGPILAARAEETRAAAERAAKGAGWGATAAAELAAKGAADFIRAHANAALLYSVNMTRRAAAGLAVEYPAPLGA